MQKLFLQSKTRGITAIGVLIAIGIIGMMSSIVLSAFGQFRARQTLDASVEEVLAAFSAAHLDTVSSKNDDTYGVNLKNGEVIYFKGGVYPGDNDVNNMHFVLPGGIEVANVSLNGGGNYIYYKRLSGATNYFGTFDVQVRSNTNLKTTVTVNQSGATSI